jgi:DNA-binding GntR family transcriptional regulator
MDGNAFERPSLTEIAYEEIKKRIFLGKFSPGHKLVVDELVKAFAISNTPIKEALNRLVAEGLVEALPRRGMHVKVISEKEIKELCELRLVYETYCARRAVKVIDEREDVKAKLSESVDAFGKLMENRAAFDYQSHTRVDEEFHMAIMSLTENDMLIKEYTKLNSIRKSNDNYAARELPLKRSKEAYEEHKAIYEALIKKDMELLIESVEKHIKNIEKDMLKFIITNTDLG